ncbi:MAG: ABC transporter permease subunit [Phycisphaerales bacterium]|nr:MAG: ABC transporter permease subunit [Phycisphaerales bacterium]
MLKSIMSKEALKNAVRSVKALISKESLKNKARFLRAGFSKGPFSNTLRLAKANIARESLIIGHNLRLLRAIIAKEFLNNILNLRFMIGLVLCLLVTIACIIILSHDYQQEMKDHNTRVNLQEEFLSKYSHRGWLFRLIPGQKPPERFRPLIISIAGSDGRNSIDDNPLPVLFPHLDFLFIVTIIMSLMALLFSYDAVTGERQRGTLRQMISNSISRTTILFGKFIGGTASLLIPFVLALLVGVLCINLNPNIRWDGSAWAELGLLTAASVTFIMLFYLLGLMISAFSRYSGVSILNCLFLWVLLILVIPNVCPYVSAQLRRIPSVRATERRTAEIERACWKARRQRRREVVDQFRTDYGRLFSEFEASGFGRILDDEIGDREKVEELAAADPQFKAMVDAFRRELDRVRSESRQTEHEATAKLWEDLNTKAAAQTRLAKKLACISPFANFVYVARDLTGTGLRSLEYFEQFRDEYRKRFWRYAWKVEEAAEAAHKDEPSPPGGLFLDLRDHPRFVFKEEALKSKLKVVMPYWGILVAFNVVFFVAAFAGFMRYDVR